MLALYFIYLGTSAAVAQTDAQGDQVAAEQVIQPSP
jgi:hypothetical protein